MENRSGEVHVETDGARGGSTPNIVRWILGISLLAAIVLLSVVWMTGAATHSDRNGEVSVNPSASPTSPGTIADDADEFQTTPADGGVDPNRVAN